MGGKWLELLKEVAPAVRRVALMFSPDTGTAAYYLPSFEAAARALRVTSITAPVRNETDIEAAITSLAREPGGGLVLPPDGVTTHYRAAIISAAARNKMPAVYAVTSVAKEGGLLSYGPDTVDIHRRVAIYVDRILRGAKPADLPVQLPVKFETVVNLKAAKAIGIDVPTATLLRATEVIE
jgi:putative ABC transport system substrate-binding protein